jgi:hypothetical protein
VRCVSASRIVSGALGSAYRWTGMSSPMLGYLSVPVASFIPDKCPQASPLSAYRT